MAQAIDQPGQAGALSQGEIEITPAMIDAGVREFERWFELPEHQEDLVGLPSRSSIAAMVSASFRSMMAFSPLSR